MINKKALIILIVIITCTTFFLFQGHAEEKKSAEPSGQSSEHFLKVFDKVVEALGGRNNLEESKNWNYRAKIQMDIPVSEDPPKFFECLEHFKAPEKVRRDCDYRLPARKIYMRYLEIFDGRSGWSSFGTPGKLTEYEEEKKLKRVGSPWLKDWHLLNRLLEFYKDEYKKEFLGEDKIDGRDIYKLKIDYGKENSLVEILFIDRNTYFPTQLTRTWKEKDGSSSGQKYYYDDFRWINGIRVPFKAKYAFKSKKSQEEIIIVLKELEYNPDLVIEDVLFSPESVSQTFLDEYKRKRINHQIEPKVFKNGKLESVDGYLILHLKGTPQEMGAQHGYLMKDYIKLLLEEYLEKGVCEGKEKNKNYFLEKAKIMEKYIPEEYIQEMRSLAEMAEIDYHDILIINTIYESLMSIGKGPGCSAFSVDEKGTKNGRILFSRNLDFDHYEILYKFPVIIYCSPSRGNKFVSFTFPGFIGCPTAINENNLTLALLRSLSENSSFNGLTAPLLARNIVQHMNNFEEAIDFIAVSKRTFPVNVFLVQKNPKRMTVVEYDSKGVAAREANNGYLICTNHFRKLTSASYCPRFEKLDRLVKENYGKILEDGNFLKDPAVMQPTLNIQSLIFVLDNLEFYVSQNQVPAALGPYIKFSFDEHLSKDVISKDAFIEE